MIRLIARREIVVRSRDRTTFIGTAVTIAILAAIILLPSLFGGTTTITVATGDTEVLRAAEGLATVYDVEVERSSAGGDLRQAVVDERADAAVVDGAIVIGASAPDETEALLQEASRQVRAQAPDPPPLTVDAIDSDAEDRQAFAAIALIILYGQLIGYGFWVAIGVVEEKASRIVEILLATIRPRELLFGKVLGIGVVGLGQLLLIALAGLGIGLAAGEIELGGDELSTLPTVLGWFVLGYAMYAGAFALAGSLVSRQEDVQSVTTPLLMGLLASFFLGFQAVDDPGGTLAQVLSFIPISAPLVMPVRMIAGDVGVLTVLVSVAIVLASTYAVIAFAARLYGTAVLQTGSRIKLRDLARS